MHDHGRHVDDEDRLVAWERDDAAQDLSWVLSDVGDWDSYTENTVTQNRTHNDVHELTAIDSSPLTYDPKGNLTADEAGIDYAWDADNMLNSADVPATPDRGIEGTHTYDYDALGRRVSKTVDDAVGMTSTTTVFVCLTQPIPYSPWAGQVLAEYTSGTAAGSPLRKYAYGEHIDEPLVLIDRTAAGSTGAGSDEPFYYHAGQQYSVVALSDSGGNVAERYRYTPYGETTILAAKGTTVRTASDVGNGYTYTGRRLDGESGLHYFRARHIGPKIARFIARDFLCYQPGTWNLYEFVQSRPLYYIDPSGLDAQVCATGAANKAGHVEVTFEMTLGDCGLCPPDKQLLVKVDFNGPFGDKKLAIEGVPGKVIVKVDSGSGLPGGKNCRTFPGGAKESKRLLDWLDSVTKGDVCSTILGSWGSGTVRQLPGAGEFEEYGLPRPSCVTFGTQCIDEYTGDDDNFRGDPIYPSDVLEDPNPVWQNLGEEYYLY